MKPNLTAHLTNVLIDEKDITKLSRFFRGKALRKVLEIPFNAPCLQLIRLTGYMITLLTTQGQSLPAGCLATLGLTTRLVTPNGLKNCPVVFITIANHPYGGLDGIMLIDILARIRPDFKIMANKQLSANQNTSLKLYFRSS